jgi:amino acid adenylation domain-containing protein/thioester reductase-like protein
MTAMSSAQQRMWFLHELQSANAVYNVAAAFRMTGPLDRPTLARALADVVERHEALRTIFPEADGEPYQEILDPSSARPDMPVLSVAARAVDNALRAFVTSRFNLRHEIPIRARLLTVAPEEHILVLVVHHIAVDERSLRIVLRDLAAAYAARLDARSPPWTPSPPQYDDYATWQRTTLGSVDDPASQISRELTFWRRTLAGAPDRLALPVDRPHPAQPSHRGGRMRFTVAPAQGAVLRQLARTTGATAFMHLTALLAALLTRLGCGSDITIGTPITGRTRRTFEDVVGFLTNTVVLRIDTSGDPEFRTLVERVRSAAIGAYSHSNAPFDRVVAALGPGRNRQINPLFQVMLSLQGLGEPPLDLPGVVVERLPVHEYPSRFDLTFYVTEARSVNDEPAGMLIDINYAVDLFDEATIARMGRYLLRMLDTFARRPHERLNAVELLSPAERRTVLAVGPTIPVDTAATSVPEMFERQAAATPDAPAVASARGMLSYADLDGRANRLAGYLLRMGVGPEMIVALALPRSEEMIVAMLAVLKAGAAYLPVDPGYPSARIEFMLADAQPACVLSARRPASELSHVDVPWLLIDGPDVVAALQPSAADDPEEAAVLRGPIRPAHAAYLLYTSGSTGQPKGVVVEHSALANYVQRCRSAYRGLQGHTIVHSSFSFDFTATSLYGALTVGGCVHVAALDDDELTSTGLPTVDFLKVTPSHLAILALLPKSRVPTQELVLGGEPVFAEALAPWREAHPDVDIVNHFGPTEATVGCLDFRLSPADALGAGPVPIGRPIANVRAYVLDERLRPVPPGVVGQLYVAGAGLARGYLRRPGLTAEQFLPDPFGPAQSRIYRTGDLVRQRDDGNFVFIGRVDSQVKIRGHRVEVGEVERTLRLLPGVAEAAVIVRADPPGPAKLVGYASPAAGASIDGSSLRDALVARLPDYLVPSAVVIVDALPLTVNGKVDRTHLAIRHPSEAPPTPESGSPLVDVIRQAFAAVLGQHAVGPDDDFFALGGDSLSAVSLVRRLRTSLDVDISLRLFLASPRPANLANALTGRDPDDDHAADPPPQARPVTAPRAEVRSPRRHQGAVTDHVLLTGATGFFGAFTLLELLNQTDASIHCLVRAPGEAQAWRRLLDNLGRYGRGLGGGQDRVRVVAGDLERTDLGLGPHQYAELCRTVDVIVHSAAHVNGVLPLDRLWKSNVGGTIELARMAVTAKPKTVHFVSTMSVTSDARQSGYARSKREAEQFVMNEQRNGLAATIARLPRLSGDSTTGHYNKQDIAHRMVVAMLTAGVAPDIDFTEVWLPVDLAARAFVATSWAASDGGHFTYTSVERFSLQECLRCAQQVGFDLEVLPYHDWERAIATGPLEYEFALAALRGRRERRAPQPGNQVGRSDFSPVTVPGVNPQILATWLRRLAESTLVAARHSASARPEGC